MNRHEAPSSNAIRRWIRQWREVGSVTCKKPPDRPPSVRTPKNIVRVSTCWCLSAAIPGDLHVSPPKREACLTGVFGTSSIFTHTNCKLCIFLIGTKRWVYNFVVIFKKQNFRYWSAVIPHEPPLYDPKVTVWYAF